MRVRLNKNTAEVVRLRCLADRITKEAENLSPVNQAHPVPVMLQWARTITDIAAILEAR